MPCANRYSQVLKTRTLSGPVHTPRATCRAKESDRGTEVEICGVEANLGLSSFLGTHCAFSDSNEAQCPHFRFPA